MSGDGSQTNNSGGGFWKIHHAAIGIAILLLMIFVMRSCGSEPEDEKVNAGGGADDAIPRQTIVVEVPAAQWQGQRPPVTQQAYPPVPVYPAQQPIYGYPVQPPVQQPPAYQVDPENPWAVQRQQPVYGAGSRSMPQQAPRWGQRQQERRTYPQQPGTSQFRPLDGDRSAAREKRAATPAAPRSAAPYDRLSGSSFGANSDGQGSWPHAGAYPGYGATPYGGVPGGYSPMVPGAGYPRGLYPGAW